MKLITAIIQPHRLDDVKKELYAAEVNLVTVSEALGHGRQLGVDEFYRGVKETGKIGDGKIFVTTLDRCIRIRTGEEGAPATG